MPLKALGSGVGQLARGAKLGNPQIANARRRAVEAVKAEADHEGSATHREIRRTGAATF
jgi:hypothetical protein